MSAKPNSTALLIGCQGDALTSVKPLRRIVAREGRYDILECGHRMLVKTDGFGRDREAFYSRRCRKCQEVKK